MFNTKLGQAFGIYIGNQRLETFPIFVKIQHFSFDAWTSFFPPTGGEENCWKTSILSWGWYDWKVLVSCCQGTFLRCFFVRKGKRYFPFTSPVSWNTSFRSVFLPFIYYPNPVGKLYFQTCNIWQLSSLVHTGHIETSNNLDYETINIHHVVNSDKMLIRVI